MKRIAAALWLLPLIGFAMPASAAAGDEHYFCGTDQADQFVYWHATQLLVWARYSDGMNFTLHNTHIDAAKFTGEAEDEGITVTFDRKTKVMTVVTKGKPTYTMTCK